MRQIAILAVLFIVGSTAFAGETKLVTDGGSCTLTSADGGVASSADDADCVWSGSGTSPAKLSLQCTAACYYSKDGSAPTTTSPLISVGDPYPINATVKSATTAIKVLPVSGTATCNIYARDP